MSGLDNLTTKQLKDIIRKYKKEKCPPYSKLKKSDLEALVSKLGLNITLIPKKKKEPKPVPKPVPKKKEDEEDEEVEKPDIKDIAGSLTPEQIEKYKASGNQSWTASNSNMLMVYDYVLDKHSNDCIPIIKSINGKDAVLLIEVENVAQKEPKMRFAWNKDGKTYDDPASPEDLKLAIKKLRECRKRFVPLPFLFFSYKGSKFDFGHLNMIIIDLQSNTAEHLEPHGEEFGRLGSSDESKNKSVQGLKFLIDKKLPELFKEWGFTYKNPNESCPYNMGVQSIDPLSKWDNSTKISRVVELNAYNNFSQEQGGLCALWSYILLDLRLSNPDYTIAEIMKKVLKQKSIKEFETDVLEDFAKSMSSFEALAKFDKEQYTEILYKKWKKQEELKLSDIFFMYAITFAHEAFGKNTPILIKILKEQAEKNGMDNFMDFLKSSKLNPFKLMWYFDNVKNKPIKLVYMSEDGLIKSGKNKGELKYKKKEVNNPNGLYTYAFFRNVEDKMKDIMFDRLLGASSIRVLKEDKGNTDKEKELIRDYYGIDKEIKKIDEKAIIKKAEVLKVKKRLDDYLKTYKNLMEEIKENWRYKNLLEDYNKILKKSK